uniref:Uncharacterized protein n=1 Tax=Rhizophora mucronata TaxID=61149 RepID=A0A2P2QQM7_RHIMU
MSLQKLLSSFMHFCLLQKEARNRFALAYMIFKRMIQVIQAMFVFTILIHM